MSKNTAKSAIFYADATSKPGTATVSVVYCDTDVERLREFVNLVGNYTKEQWEMGFLANLPNDRSTDEELLVGTLKSGVAYANNTSIYRKQEEVDCTIRPGTATEAIELWSSQERSKITTDTSSFIVRCLRGLSKR
jgi:hypothetical protein